MKSGERAEAGQPFPAAPVESKVALEICRGLS